MSLKFIEERRADSLTHRPPTTERRWRPGSLRMTAQFLCRVFQTQDTSSFLHHVSHSARPSTINHEMIWKDLIDEVTAVGCGSSDSAQPVTGIEYDSRRVRPGAVFVAMKGGSTDGNRYIDKALAAGALGIITDSAPTFDHLLVYQPGIPVARSRAWPPRARRKPPPPSSAIPNASLPPPASPAPTAKPPRPFSSKRCSTSPLAKPFSSAPSNITSPAKCAPRCTPRPSRATCSS